MMEMSNIQVVSTNRRVRSRVVSIKWVVVVCCKA